eukprot:scaffold167192_cov22-Prasinocladus_malaysianus.AAC.1
MGATPCKLICSWRSAASQSIRFISEELLALLLISFTTDEVWSAETQKESHMLPPGKAHTCACSHAAVTLTSYDRGINGQAMPLVMR